MKLTIGFLFLSPGNEPRRDSTVIDNETLRLLVVGVSTMEQAERMAVGLVGAGCQAIELCAGFGNLGIARIQQAVGSDIPVGAVRFDRHPLLGGLSGDAAI